MSDEFKNVFDKLSKVEKRNQISNELITIGELIKCVEKIYNINSVLDVKNYDVNKDINEENFLTFMYEDIYNIERELITVLQAITIINGNEK